MQLQEKVAEDLRRSTVVLCTAPARSGGTYGGGVGTVVGDRYIVTTKHVVAMQQQLYIWHPEDELMMNFRPVRHWDVGENCLVEVDKVLPFPAYPICRKAVDQVMKPGATILYPGGYEFYTMIEGYQLPLNVGTYNGPRGSNQYLGWGRLSHGTSGGGVVSLEDQVLVGIIYGVVAPTSTEQNIEFRGVKNLASSLDNAGVTRPSGVVATTGGTLGEQMLPETQNKYVRWGIMGLAGIGGLLIAKSLLE